ncbi:MAG: hypothetical protein WAZ18_03110 [Alphaproteobacteria bacterium]
MVRRKLMGAVVGGVGMLLTNGAGTAMAGSKLTPQCEEMARLHTMPIPTDEKKLKSYHAANDANWQQFVDKNPMVKEELELIAAKRQEIDKWYDKAFEIARKNYDNAVSRGENEAMASAKRHAALVEIDEQSRKLEGELKAREIRANSLIQHQQDECLKEALPNEKIPEAPDLLK